MRCGTKSESDFVVSFFSLFYFFVFSISFSYLANKLVTLDSNQKRLQNRGSNKSFHLLTSDLLMLVLMITNPCFGLLHCSLEDLNFVEYF